METEEPATIFEPAEGETPLFEPVDTGFEGEIVTLDLPLPQPYTPPSDSVNTLNPYTISGGGGRMTGSDLFDIKCSPFVGTMTDDNHELEIDGVGVLFPEEEVEIPETGLIVVTEIWRLEDGQIQLTWNYVEELADKKVDIWRRIGEGIEYSTAAGWVLHRQGLAGTQFTEQKANVAGGIEVGDGQNAFYRVVPTDTDPANIHDPGMNNVTVGKVDVSLDVGWNIVAIPFVQQHGYKVGDVLAKQLTPGAAPGDVLYTADLEKATFENSNWTNANLILKLGEGLYINILQGRDPITLSFVGEVPTDVQQYTLPVGFRRIGNSSCISKSLYDAGFDASFGGDSSLAGDAMYNSALDKMTKQEDTWVPEGLFTFKVGEGYWYYRQSKPGQFNWVLDPLK